MATAKRKPAQKALMSNPPKSRYVSRSKKSTARKRRNPSTAIAKRTSSARRRSYRRNPGPSTNAALFALGGAFAIVGFDEVVNRFFPSVSGPVRIGAKVAAGYAVGTWGKKLPLIGSFAAVIQGALWTMAALDAINTWVRPMFGGWLTPAGAPAIANQAPVTNPATGELGTRLFMTDGSSMDVYEGSSQYAYS